jgi:hypothetical protein
MKKLNLLRILFVAVRIAHDIIEALNDPASPGHITVDELKIIVTNAIAYVLDNTA